MPEVEIDGIGTVVFPEDMSLADIQQESARLYDNHSAYSTGVQPSALVSRQAQEMMPPSIREAMNRGAQAPLQQQITQGAARSMGPVYERNQQEAEMRQLQRSPEPVEGAADWSISDVADVVEPVLRPWASTPENPLGGFASAVRPVGQAINELGDEAVGIYQGVANSYGLQTGSVDRDVVKALPGIAAAMTGAGTLSRLGLAESLAAPVAFGGVPFAQTLAATDDTFAAVKAGAVGTLIPGTAEVGRAMAAKTLGSLVERGILGTGATAAGNMGQKAVEALGAQGAIQVFMEGMNLPEYVMMAPEDRKAALLHNLAVNSAFLMMDVPGVFGRSTSRTRQGRSETLWEAKKTGMKPAAKVGELLESLVNDPEFTARLTRLADEFALEQMNPRNAQLQAQAPEIGNVEPRFIDPEREPLRGVEQRVVEDYTDPAPTDTVVKAEEFQQRPAEGWQAITGETPKAVRKEIKDLQDEWRSKGVDLHVTNNDGQLQLGLIQVSGEKGAGLGSKAIESVNALADGLGLRVTLTALADKGKQAELERFYTRHGYSKVGTDPLNGKPIFAREPTSPVVETAAGERSKAAPEIAAPAAKAPEAARPAETLTPEQMREQRTRYWTGIKRGLIETDAGGTVRLIESSSKPGHFDVWHTLDGKRELVGEAEKPRRLQAAQDYAVQFALKQGGKVADAPVAPESSEGDLVRGDRFRDGEGKQFEVWKNRQGTIEAHPVVDGKPVVNRESTVRFSVTPEARARNPEDRVFGAAPADPAPKAPKELTSTAKARAGAKEFDRLVLEHGMAADWVKNPEALYDETVNVETGHGTGSIKAKILRQKEMAKARKQAAAAIGAKDADLSKPEVRAQLADKLKAWVEENIAKPESQAKEFSNAIEKGPVKVPVSEMKVGDTLNIEGEPVRVVDVSAEGDVTLQDGTRFGKQVMQDGTVIYAEEWNDGGASDAWMQEQPAAPKLKGSQKQGDLLGSGDVEFNLYGEKASDGARIAAERAQAEATRKAAAEFAAKNQQEFGINTGNLGELGMGGAKPTEFTAGSGTPTSIKNATVDAERSKRGLPPAMEAGRRTWGEVWERAMAIIDQDPAAQNVLIAQLKAQPRALTDIEDALLLHRQIDLQNQYGRQTRELATAYDDAKNFPGRLEAVERFKVMVQETSKDLFELYEVGKAAGTETGRGLAARKMLADEHFELAQMEMEKREAREGAPLTDAERAELTQAHDTIQRLQAEFAAAEARHEAAAADRRAAEATEDLKQAAKADPDYNPVVIKWAERIVDKLERTGKEAEAQWKQMMARTSSGVDPTLLAVAIKIGAGKIARKAMPFAEWAQTMVDAVGESIRPYLQPAWDKLGERIDKVATDIAGRKKAEALKKVRVVDEDARRERLIGSITEAAGEDRPLDEIGTYVRRLALQFVKDGISDRNRLVDAVHSVLVNHFDPAITRREAMDAISGYGDFKPLDPDAAKRTLRDLKGQLQSVAKLEDIVGRRPLLKTGVERRAPSDEERRLIQQVNEAKRVHGVVTTDPARQLKGAQDAILTRLKHQIADLNFQIDAGARTVKGGSKVASTPEMDGLRHARNELRKRLDELLPRPGISEAQRIATAERGLAADIELYEFKIAARETGPLRGKSARLNSAKLDQLRARRDVLKAELAELRAAAGHTQAKRLADLVARSEQLAQRINAGEIATVKPPTRAESPAMTTARAEHKQLVEMMAKLRKAATGETKELHSLEQRSAELARRINEGDISRPAKVKVAGSPELEAARAEHKQLVKALNELRRAAEASPEERAMATLNRRIATEYAKVMDRIARSDYAPRRRREVPPMDAATAAAKGRLDQAKTDWRRGLVAEQRRNRSLAEKGWDAAKEVAHAQRQIWTSIDLSALLRQGGLVVAGHPIRGLKSTPAMLRALSETQFNAEWARVQARPNWSRYQRAKLYLSNPHETTITKLEEEVRSRWLQKVPGIKQSNQTYATFLNKLRADSFDVMVSAHERKGRSLTDAELRGIANYINIATGRGDFGKLAGAADTLAIGFFSPRLLLSRFQYIMGQPLYKAGSWRVRRQIAAEYARTLAGFAVVLALGLIAGAKIETDPTSSDFLKLRFGNTRVDLGAGILQPLVYLARTIRGEKKTPDGKRVPIRGAVPFGGDDWADVTLNFGRSKFSPAMGTTWDLISGKNVVGEKVTLGSAAELFFIPLSFREVGKTMQDQGVPAGTVMRVLGLLGAGVDTYDSDEKSRKVVGALMKEIRGGTPEQREAIRQRLTEALKK
jgi:hypothetical protein